jgi:cobalt/nickel transport system permease protein
MTCVIIFAARIPPLFYGKLLLLPIFFLSAGVLTVATNANSRDMIFGVLFFHNPIGVSASSLNEAAVLFMKALGAVSCLYFLILTVPVTEIIHILRKCKVPTLFIELMTIVYKFIFIIFETMNRIYVSQKSRLGYGNYITGYKSLGRLISSLFIISLKRYEDMYNALESRCFTGDFHFYGRDYIFSKTRISMMVGFDGLMLFINLFYGDGF